MYPIVDIVEHQTIASVQKEADLDAAIRGKVNVVFLLAGSLLNVREQTEQLKMAGKHVFLHTEFIEGLAADRSGVAYIARHVKPTGIISTKSMVIKAAKENGLMAIQRIFLIDRNAVLRGIKAVEQNAPDAVEVMPGIMPRIIREVTTMTPLPIIAGGLVANQQEIDEGLEAGALGISVGSPSLW